ncbi:transposable element Tcb2 transposase [Trichonephila inaurata madagascariensis]|uniref:Transposable element Tcb2 transposase n=1 Tax=Trichonephila inaurata madagascariensis TaxID=2747483 RepID=A0A8X6YCP7_9ARAC|nr:transposable element Tcb2 transposase [Trichonephila inaurata madagascariensis]
MHRRRIHRELLHIFELGSVTTQQYCREIILGHVRIFRGSLGPGFLFMNGNTWPHRSVEVSENILRIQWHANCPDQNPIEHALDTLVRRAAQRTTPPYTVQELKTAMREEWVNIPRRLLDSLVKSTEFSLNRRVDISIVFDRHNYYVHEKQPKYNIVEVMSNIGGFLGMWMGVSLIAILNLFEIVLTIFVFCIKRRKSKKKTLVINIA